MTETKLGIDPSETWGYYNSLPDGRERDGLGEDWYNAGALNTATFNDAQSIQRLHQQLDTFNRVLQENPDDTRYKFVVVASRLRMTPQNKDDQEDLIILIQPSTDNVTLDNLRTFTGKVRGEQNT